MTAHEREALADRCARCDASGTPDAQALLAEARAQVEEARQERDEALERARISDRCRLANEAELRRADARIGLVRTALTNACDCAAQALLAEKALAAEKSALASRVAVLDDLLRRYRDHHDDLTHEAHGGADAGCFCSLCDEARAALEVEP